MSDISADRMIMVTAVCGGLHKSCGRCGSMWLPLTLLTVICAAVLCVLEGPRAKCENGPLVGIYETSHSGFKYLAFRGIPYAKPPVGKHRFKEPQRIDGKWIGEWNAQSYGRDCLQLDEFSRTKLANNSMDFNIIGDEDCLFINIFTQPEGPPQKDVIFAIHGGAFMFGYGELLGPDYIMDRGDVVYVNFNYRVGPLGFLTTGDHVVPGNNGLKDQVAALEWVRRNIAHFGGDPNKISIIGVSAGGASVDYMYLTPLTKGLFQRGYSFSGSSLCPWALIKDGVEKTRKLAEIVGCPSTDSETIVKCLRRRPAKQIIEAVRSFLVFLYNPFTIFGPVVEVNSSRPYLDQEPKDILKKKQDHQLPWIVGVTTEDGLYPAAEFMAHENLIEKVDTEWETIGPSLLFLDPKLSTKEVKEVLHQVKKGYFGNALLTKGNLKALVRLLTERLFMAGILESAYLREESYLYLYGYQGATNIAHAMDETVRGFGACHGDDLSMVVKYKAAPSHTTPRDIAMAKILKNNLFTFVKQGKVPDELQWKPWSKSKSYLFIQSPDDISVSEEQFVDLNLHRKLFKEEKPDRDEL